MTVLRVYSDAYSFQSCAATTEMALAGCVDKGQIGRRQQPEPEHRLHLSVSRREWEDFPGQVADAIAFLRKHESELSDLLHSPAVTEAGLDFPTYPRLNEQLVAQYDHLPRELIRLVGSIGLSIEMSIYAMPESV